MAIALFPLRNPIMDATGCFGRIAMHSGTWSGIMPSSHLRRILLLERSNLFQSHSSNQRLTGFS